MSGSLLEKVNKVLGGLAHDFKYHSVSQREDGTVEVDCVYYCDVRYFTERLVGAGLAVTKCITRPSVIVKEVK